MQTDSTTYTIEAKVIGKRSYGRDMIAYVYRCACGWSSGFTYSTEDLARRFGTLADSTAVGHHSCR